MNGTSPASGKTKVVNLLWSVALILAGAVILAQNFGVLGEFSGSTWGLIFAGLSVLFFASYLLHGVTRWGWLFPALGCAALSITVFWGEAGGGGSAMGFPILISLALPFGAAYLIDREKHSWAWIPAYVLGCIAVVTLLADTVQGEWIGALVLWAVALPFYGVLMVSQGTRSWALIPALVLTVVGAIPPLTLVATGDLVGAFVMFLFALPFLVVYLVVHKAWWALIPTGTFIAIGASVLVAGNTNADGDRSGIVGAVLFLLLAATFGIAWLRRRTQPTAWAMWPALGLAIAGVASLVWSSNLQAWWPAIPIVLGIALLVTALRPRPDLASQDDASHEEAPQHAEAPPPVGEG